MEKKMKRRKLKKKYKKKLYKRIRARMHLFTQCGDNRYQKHVLHEVRIV